MSKSNTSTLVWSAKPNNPDVLIYTLEDPIVSFVEALFSYKSKRKPVRTDRLFHKNGKLYYNASDEYKAYVVRMKNIK